MLLMKSHYIFIANSVSINDIYKLRKQECLNNVGDIDQSVDINFTGTSLCVI